MRHLFALLITAFCISLLPSCQKEIMVETETITDTIVDTVRDTITIDLNRGLVAYYPFSGNANDSSGNNKHGTVMNGLAYSTDAHNNANRAASFDGVDDYITVADPTNAFSPPKLSVAFQVYLTDASARNMFICKSDFPTPSSVSWGVNLSNKIGFTVADPTSGMSPCGQWLQNPVYDLPSNTQLQNNRWYHITVIYNLGVELIYIDGELDAARVSNYSSLMQCNQSHFKIGGWWQNDIISVHGKMDELRVYNRILAENEIEHLAAEVN